uniref:FHA domain-containing protein n=1 Tax=Armatimonas sp. TaxID=1872638 RepID=UPI0034D98250
ASRRHAQLVSENGGVALEDLGSTNGTFVNGQRITRVALALGDQIVIGTSTLRVE